ncbi:MAG: hypothetical protein ACXW25_06660 [Rhodospirillales bacterium]
MVHIQLINLDQFLDLWMAHYEKLAEEDKSQVRLTTAYFLAPD